MVGRMILVCSIALYLSACIVGPYKSRDFEEVKISRQQSGGDKLRLFVMDGSSYEGEEGKPPYKVGIWLLREGSAFDSIEINDITITLNGNEIEGVQYSELHSRNIIKYPGLVKRINPAPCCGFMLISSELPIVHRVGDLLEIYVSITTDTKNTSSESVSYLAKTKRGIIRWVTVV